ncbi:hypothetical protein Tco_0992391 [Tanacetum coccineum]|uniref:Uncharacterized protein n=1 Tax=Tanacetum coccineum TaxID=301880 RepID=A0ABQ5F3G6_9ASTR
MSSSTLEAPWMSFYHVVFVLDRNIEIIENGNAPIVTKTVDGKETGIPPTIVEENAQRRAELKARITLLLRTDLKAYESEVKGTSSSTTNSRNVAFLSSSSTNSATRAVNTAHVLIQLALRLDDFVDANESVSESVVEKPTVETNEPKTARKENEAPIIKDWVSDSDEENMPKANTVEMFNKPSFAKINFVKSIELVKYPRKTLVDKNRQNTPSPRGNKRNWNQQMS